MDWANERYVRLYTRDTADMVSVGWEGRAVLTELLRKVDRSGVLEHGGEVELVPEMLRIPRDLFLTGFARLIKRNVITATDTAIVVRNFLEAQETPQSDASRKRTERERRRTTEMSRGVTPGHVESQNVTPTLPEPDPSEPSPSADASHPPTYGPLFADGTGQTRKAPRTAAAPTGEHQQFIAEFEALYIAANSGSRPTWGKKQGGWVRDLLKRPGGFADAVRRAQNMFHAPPDWPPPPHDLGTLVAHFDKFAQPHARARAGPARGYHAVTGTEVYPDGEVKL